MKKVVQVTMTNLAKTAVTVRPVSNDFVAGDERGTPALILDDTQYAPTHSLKRFMSPLSPVTIPGRGSKTVSVVVTVPSSAQAGGYFGSIRFVPTTPDGGGQVNLSPSVASLILLKVPGAIVEDVAVTDFEVQRSGGSHFYFQKPDNLSLFARFRNDGNVQVAPLGKIQVYQGKEVVFESDFNAQDPKDTILPDSARRWDVPLKNIGSIGRFRLFATYTYGEKNNTIELSRTFYIAPLWLVLCGLASPLIILGIIVWIVLYRVRRRSRGKNRGHRRGRHTAQRRRFGA